MCCAPGRVVRGVASLILGLAATAPRLCATTATLIADAHVDSARPDANSGAISNLAAGGGFTTLLEFDLGALPAGTTAAQVSRATLRLYANRVDTAGTVQVQPVSAAWGEYSVTFTTRPAIGTPAGSMIVTQAGAYVTVDVTALVQGWITSPATNNGLALTAATGVVQFDSKENDLTGHAAELEIVLAATGLPGPQGPAGPAGARGAQGTAGPQGPAGPQGLAGAQGPAGPAGLQGPAGGLSYQGSYYAATTYAAGAVVSFGGSSWVSLITANRGNAPALNSTAWGLLAQAQAGSSGATGATGATGSAGPPGSAGATGPQGPAGVTGAAGARGLPGLAYQGAYNPTVNYGLGDVVTWQGAAYASLAGSNHGAVPDANPQWWGVLSARGTTGDAGPQGPAGPQGLAGPAGSVGPPGERGPQGAQGIPGQTGAQGVTGAQGTSGLQGPMGPQGPAGPVGLLFRGAYSATTNYGLADGVVYNGSGYVSLGTGNRGNIPDQSPAQWAMFAAAGGAGAQGPMGVAGVAGAQGPSGAPGSAGPQGAPGSTGPQGPAVATFKGPYNAFTSYGLNDAVSFGGSTYVSMTGSNRGATPDQSPSQWALLVSQGATGAAGPAGAAGPSGPQGLPGPQGAAGAQGPPASFAGTWQMGRSYAVGDAVSYLGSSYIALGANSGRQPDLSPGLWAPLAQAGSTGATGPAGAQGPTGPTGATGPQGPAGPQGTAGVNGANGLPGLVFRGAFSPSTVYAQNDAVIAGGSTYVSVLSANAGNAPGQSAAWAVLAQAGAAGPVGAAGATGPAGAAGPAGTPGGTGARGPAGAIGINFRGAWNLSTMYVANDAVTYAGATYLALASSSSVAPDQSAQAWSVLAAGGVAGPSGPAGPAATVTIGSVITGAAGSAAAVTNAGTGSAAVLNFTIPQGAPGAGGGSGGAASALTTGASVYHAVSFNNTYFSVANANASLSELDGTVLTWVPSGCATPKLQVYSMQAKTITVSLRAGAMGALAGVLSCQVSTNSSCTATGAVAVAAGGFVDLSISGANGAAAPVWTAVTCE